MRRCPQSLPRLAFDLQQQQFVRWIIADIFRKLHLPSLAV